MLRRYMQEAYLIRLKELIRITNESMFDKYIILISKIKQFKPSADTVCKNSTNS